MTNKSLTKLRFLCFGVGAIGSYVGGSLVLSGQEVIFLEQPEPAKYLRERGILLNLTNGTFHLENPQIVSTIEDALTQGPYDVVIFAVKSYDTRNVLKYFTPYNIALPSFLCLQNGVENEIILREILGEDKVIPATVTSAISKKNVGDITLEKLRGIGVATGHQLAPTLTAILDHAGLQARLYPDANSLKWSKMITNLLSNASAAILNMTPLEIFSHPELYQMEVEQIREALRVMAAMKIRVTSLPGTPVKALSLIIRLLPAKISQPILLQSVAKGRGEKMPSFHIDLYSGRGKSEVDFLNGAVVRFGRQYGVKTPVNQVLNETLQSLTKGEIEPSRFSGNPQALLERVKLAEVQSD